MKNTGYLWQRQNVSSTVFIILCLFFLLGSAWAVNAETIDAWLDKMSQASTQQNFQGTLIIRQKNQLQAIKVKQGVTGNGSWQTLESLTGENQTIFRQNNKVTTIFPNKKLVTIAGNSPGLTNNKGPLHPSLPDLCIWHRKIYARLVID